MYHKTTNVLTKSVMAIFCLVMILITVMSSIKLVENVYQYVGLIASIIAIVLLGAAALLLYRSPRKIRHALRGVIAFLTRRVSLLLAIVIGLALALRIGWLLEFNISEYLHDYLGYHERAMGYVDGQFPRDEYAALFPHVFGYSYFLSAVYGLFGSSVYAVQGLNLVLFLATATLLLCLFPPRQQPIQALTVTAVYGFWPSLIYYTILPNTESVFIFILVLAIFVQKKLIEVKSIPQEFGLSLALGFVLACCNFIRPISMVLLIAFCLTLFLFIHGKKVWRRMLIALIVIGVYFSSVSLFHDGIGRKIGLQTATFPIGFNVFVGTNPVKMGEDLGLWNEGDSVKLAQTFKELQNAQAAHDAMLELGIERLKGTADAGGLLEFIFLKMKTAWGTESWSLKLTDFHVENYAQNEGASGLLKKLYDGLIAGGDVVYTLFMLSIAILVIKRMRNSKLLPPNGTALFSALFVIGVFLMLVLVESDPRYHVPAIVAIFVLLGELQLTPLSKNIYFSYTDKCSQLQEGKSLADQVI